MLQVGDLIIVNAIDQIAIGTQFERRRNEWPLHITIMPWFSVNNKVAFMSKLQDIAAKMQPFNLRIGDLEYFGPNKDIPVNIVTDQASIKALHHEVLSALYDVNAELHEDNYTGDSYRAHITRHIGAINLEGGAKCTINNLQLVELLENDICRTVATFIFKASS